MATYTDNYQLTKPTYAEQADIGVINSNMNIIDDIMHSSQISLAPAYDSTQTYAEGDVVMYELLMYKCISPTTGVWDGSKWERTTASESGGGGSAELDILGEASGAVASFADGASAGLAKCIVEIVPTQAGSGTPSPSNVRAISGHTAVNVNVAGKNLLDNTLCIERTNNGIQRIVNNDGTITLTGTSTVVSQWWSSVDNLGVFFKKGTYTISCNEIELRALFRKAQVVSGTFTLSDDDYLDNVIFRTTVGETYNLRTEPMIRLATESAEFEPYKGNTTTTPLGQTVYGGQLNVLTGELTIDQYMVVLDGVNNIVSISGATNPNGRTVLYSAQINTVDVYRAMSLCDKLVWSNGTHAELSLSEYTATVAGGGATMTVRFVLPISETATATESNAYIANNNYTFVFPLATPQTVQLTPQEVNSLLGQNNISADTGDIDIVYVKTSAPIQPNPTGTPTATLSKLGIEGTVFEIPSGGGGSSSGINYSTTEQKTGRKWIDGKDIYEKTYTGSFVVPSGGTWYDTSIALSDVENLIDAQCRQSIAKWNFISGLNNSGTLVLINPTGSNLTVESITIQYTKITD